MAMNFISVISERERFGNAGFNVVAFGEDTECLERHADLLAAADLIQSRFLYASFLLEASPDFSREALLATEDAFEVDIGSNLFCVPFARRMRLHEGTCAMATFGTYSRLFDALRGDSETVDVEEVWEDCFENHGLLTFRLILDE